MLVTEYKETTKVEKTYIPLEMHCDFCGKKLDPRNWFEATTHHSDWGNDSHESLKRHDICSDECAVRFAKEYLGKAYSDGKIRKNTMAIEFEHMNRIRDYDEERDYQ